MQITSMEMHQYSYELYTTQHHHVYINIIITDF
jgi:hypothetical protein